MTLPGSIVLVGVSLAVAMVLQILRRWTTVVAWMGALSAGALGTLVLLAPLDEPWQIRNVVIELGAPFIALGRVLVIEPVDRLPLAFLFLTTAGLFLVAWRLLPHSNFFPIGLVAVTLLGSALMVQQVVYAALLVAMASILTVFPLHESGGSAKGGVLYMAYAALALPGLMITQLLLDQFVLFPNDRGLLTTSAVLLSFSFAVLFGAVPFQSWLSAVATDGSPPVVTFIFTVNMGTVWFMLLAYLESYVWLGQQTAFGSLLTTLGLVMMVAGGILAASQQRLGRLVGYATLVDNGAMLLSLGAERVEGLAIAALLLIARPLALSLMTLGLQGLKAIGKGDDSWEAVRGAAWRVPWRVLAFVVGGVALAGFPISLGFTARWGLYRVLASQELLFALLSLAGSGGVMLGLIGSIRALLSRKPRLRWQRKRDEDGLRPVVEDPVVLVVVVVLVIAIVMLGLLPQGASRVALEMAEWHTFFR
ncbi:MAG: hypothetical protein JXB35_08565 [Anaerolineae bacterium]|nr:hypothetical protein [Anaerolineae bacterium]